VRSLRIIADEIRRYQAGLGALIERTVLAETRVGCETLDLFAQFVSGVEHQIIYVRRHTERTLGLPWFFFDSDEYSRKRSRWIIEEGIRGFPEYRDEQLRERIRGVTEQINESERLGRIRRRRLGRRVPCDLERPLLVLERRLQRAEVERRNPTGVLRERNNLQHLPRLRR
jgi:hypothetical protein